MENLKRYNQIFAEILGLDEEELHSAEYKKSEQWDSVGHMSLISALEEDFNIMFDPDDIMDFTSYDKGIQIMQNNYHISF